ncbi:MAG: glycosyltransferase [Actinomycetota bacterium]
MGSHLWADDGPVFSILVPIWHPDPAHLEACVASVLAQTTAEWELCLVLDGPQPTETEDTLARIVPPDDDRVRIHRRQTNGGIGAATDDGLAMATGRFIALLDNDDTLAPDALGTVAWELAVHDDVDLVFSDEDHLDAASSARINPFFKPGFSVERLRQQMYLGHLLVIRRSVAVAVGGFRPGYDGSQDHDLALRVAERARRVLHVPKLLYHWRESPTSTALDPSAKDWAYEAGVRAVASHLERTGFPATASRNPDWPGIIDLTPALTAHPEVSVIIPTGGTRRSIAGIDTLLAEQAVATLAARTAYPPDRLEVVAVLDADADPDLGQTLDLAAGPIGFVAVRDHRPFNFAAACNLGAVRAAGEVLVFLNDDTEISQLDWVERLVMYATRPDIGAVGAKLLYGDGRIQHAGTWSRNGNPHHRYVGYHRNHPGYLASLATAQNCLAVTAACLAVERTKFAEVGGFATQFPLAYNDVDLCLKLSRSGYRTVVDCATEVVHHESSSRDPTVADWEFDALRRRWAPILDNDPYDNPNHTANGVDEYPPTSVEVIDLRRRRGDDYRARSWPATNAHLRA